MLSLASVPTQPTQPTSFQQFYKISLGNKIEYFVCDIVRSIEKKHPSVGTHHVRFLGEKGRGKVSSSSEFKKHHHYLSFSPYDIHFFFHTHCSWWTDENQFRCFLNSGEGLTLQHQHAPWSSLIFLFFYFFIFVLLTQGTMSHLPHKSSVA